MTTPVKPQGKRGKAVKERQRWNDHCDALHMKKLAEMKPKIDNAPPDTLTVGQMRETKPAEMRKERQAEIDHENQVLMSKLRQISKSPVKAAPGGPAQATAAAPHHSLNRPKRKRELDRVNAENLKLVKALQQIKPVVRREEWEQASREQEKLLGMIGEFPPIKQAGAGAGARKSPKASPAPPEKLPPTNTRNSAGAAQPAASVDADEDMEDADDEDEEEAADDFEEEDEEEEEAEVETKSKPAAPPAAAAAAAASGAPVAEKEKLEELSGSEGAAEDDGDVMGDFSDLDDAAPKKEDATSVPK